MIAPTANQERRRLTGVALVSLRRAWLADVLNAHDVAVRHVVPQLGASLFPAFRPPLLLDVLGIPMPMLVAMLWELRHTPSLSPTLIVLPAHAPGLHRLAAIPSAVSLLVAETTPADQLARWLRVAPHLVRRAHQAPPAGVGLPPLPPGVLPLPTFTLDVLRALAPYGAPAPQSVTEAAARAGVSRRLFCYRLAAIRAVLGISPERRFRPPDLAAAITTAIWDGVYPAP